MIKLVFILCLMVLLPARSGAQMQIPPMSQPDKPNNDPLKPNLSRRHANTDLAGVTEGNYIVEEYKNLLTPNERFRRASRGIILIGGGKNLRAASPFGGSTIMGEAYANAVNEYKKCFGHDVNVYCMIIPTALEYYCPDNARQYTSSEYLAINRLYGHLSDSVKAVDVYTPLGRHASEDIYLRTDHHWSALGAYYAAREFAYVAGVPFRELDNYDSVVVRDFVGTMHKFSRDASVKRAPEDFVYYVPRDVEYTTTYINYATNRKRKPVAERAPQKGDFFRFFPDGSPAAYSTFIGGDANTTKVVTSTKNGRRLLLLKDSFGNAIPGYLFHSFEEINIVDYRYFLRNIVTFVNDNKVTDILFANNNAHAHSSATSEAYMTFLKRRK